MQTFNLDKPEDVTTLRDLIKTDEILKRAYDAIKMLEYLTTRNIILGNKSGQEEAVAMQTLLDAEQDYVDSRGIPFGSQGKEPVYSAVVDLATKDTRQELENDPIVMKCLIRKCHTLDRYLL